MSERNMWIGKTGRNSHPPKAGDYIHDLSKEVLVLPVIDGVSEVVEEPHLAINNLLATGKAFDDIAPRGWLKY